MTGETAGPLYLSHDALERLPIGADEVVASIERLLLARGQARAWNAPKAVIQPPDGRYMMATLSAADDPPFLAVKALLLNPRNRERGLSDINAVVTLLDSDTGLPLAVVDGNWVTAVRTAGLSAVAARRLARPESSVMAFIGCGVQAQSHLRLFSKLFPLSEVRAFGRGAARRDALCRSAEAMGLRAVPSATAGEAVTGADLVVTSITLTPDVTAFLDPRWLAPGAFATMTDLARPWLAEGMTAFARIVIDDMDQEAGMARPMVDPRLVTGDLTGLVQGTVPGRGSREERAAFTFRGLALGDLALAALAYQRATGHR
jgi:ornithine cyclodeaminase/alanine dehydrogenase-like protein (mu-crystallin family)